MDAAASMFISLLRVMARKREAGLLQPFLYVEKFLYGELTEEIIDVVTHQKYLRR